MAIASIAMSNIPVLEYVIASITHSATPAIRPAHRSAPRTGRAGAHASSDIASQCSLRSGDMRAPQSADYITTTFTFDSANQLVSSTTDGVTTHYAYDAAGRLVREGSKTYRYG